MAKKLQTFKVTTLAAFAERVENLLAVGGAGGNWYRGVGKGKTNGLRPGLYRHPVKKKIEDLLKVEARMLADFERFSILHTEKLDSAAEQDLKKLFYMQHYGMPTRLLDWSSNPFIALYFALSTAHFEANHAAPSEDPAVWIVDPTAWNAVAVTGHKDEGPLLHSDASPAYGPRRLVAGAMRGVDLATLGSHAACVMGVTNSARMFAQRGVFTIFGRDLLPMEEQFEKGGFALGTLSKIVVPKANVSTLLSSVIRLGYTDSVSFPDLHGLALEIKRSHGFKL